jgi:hypothetical protein
MFWREDRDYVELSTMWLIGLYLGWVEIFRRDAGLALGGDTLPYSLSRAASQSLKLSSPRWSAFVGTRLPSSSSVPK